MSRLHPIMPELPLHINPFTEMGHWVSMTTNAIASFLNGLTKRKKKSVESQNHFEKIVRKQGDHLIPRREGIAT
jgi:hypothetical protein